MRFLAHCAVEQIFQDWEPQTIEIPEEIAKRFSAWQLGKLASMVDGKICEVDWDVRESSSPIVVTCSFSHFTGWSEKVETCEGDRMFYAQVQRKGPPIWGRFVKKMIPRETTSLTMVLRPVCNAGPVGWRVVTAYAGEAAPPFPGDPYETADSREYWSNHALLDGAMPYRKETVTTVCPWTVREQELAA